MSHEYETVVSVPVSYRNLPITKQLEGNLPSHLDFYFKGTGFEMMGVNFSGRPDSIIVDLADILKNGIPVAVNTQTFGKQFDSDIKPFRVFPESLAPGVSNRKGKRVPVKLIADFSYRDRFGLSGKIILRPDSIDIAGSNEQLNKIHELKTEKVAVGDLHKDYFGGVQLDKNIPSGIQLSQPYIHYYIPVVEFTEGMLTVPLSQPISQRGKVTLFPAEVKVTYQVELAKFNSVKAEDFRAVAEVPFPSHPVNLEVKMKKYPPYVRHLKWEPQFVDYLIKE